MAAWTCPSQGTASDVSFKLEGCHFIFNILQVYVNMLNNNNSMRKYCVVIVFENIPMHQQFSQNVIGFSVESQSQHVKHQHSPNNQLLGCVFHQNHDRNELTHCQSWQKCTDAHAVENNKNHSFGSQFPHST